MKNSVRLALLAASSLVLAVPGSAHAVCSTPPLPTETWTADVSDEFGQTVYSMTAPCKVFLGDLFDIVLTVRDPFFPDHIVGGSWSLVDSSANGTFTEASGALIRTFFGEWQLTVPQQYLAPDLAVDHDVRFEFRDLGQGSGAHSWTAGVSGGIVVDPLPGAAPVVTPFAGGTFQHGELVVLAGSVADLDGGTVSYRWLEGTSVLAEGTVVAAAGGEPTPLPEHVLVGLPLGAHELTLRVSDGVHDVAASVSVTVVDTEAPTLAPAASARTLWPPNGHMVPVTIAAHAHDGGGGPVSLTVEVTTGGAPAAGARGARPDFEIVAIDDARGEIALALRAELDAHAGERTYTIAVTATDGAGNASTVEVPVAVARPGTGTARAAPRR